MTQRMCVSVAIVDDHPLVAEMLARLVEADDALQLRAQCGDGQEALAKILELDPDVAVIDVGVPRLDGPEIAEAAARAGSRTKVLFLTGRDDREAVLRCVAAGGRGLVSKTAPKDDLLAAIHTVARGGTAFPPATSSALAVAREQLEAKSVLTSREKRVLELAARGCSNAEIADHLFIGPTTVKTHLRNAADKLGVHGKPAAVAEAVRRGIIG